MIKATIRLSSVFVDRPKIEEIMLNEFDTAVEYMDGTGSKQRISIGEIFNLYKTGNVYYKDARELDEQLTPETFEQWFYHKYINERGLSQRVLSIEYHRI